MTAIRPDAAPATPVAIVGMSVLLPGAPDLDSYWHNLVNGFDAITDVPANRWDESFYLADSSHGPPRPDQVYCRRGGFVDDLATVEVTRFGVMPASVPDTEPDQLIALRVAAAAIADAGGEGRLPDRAKVGVILGRGGYLTPGIARLDQRVRTAHQLVRTLGELVPDLDAAQLARVRSAFTDALGPTQPDAAIGLVPNLAASRIANRMDLHGPAYTVDAACASSLIAVDQAMGELASGRCDVMLAGGVHHCHDITFWSVFSQLRALSASQQIRPFDRRADGILIGEGTGVVVLKRLADAERDGDRIYAVIRGTGVSSDGRGASLASPDPGGQVLAVRRAWQTAGLDPTEPDSLGLLEAHGTATPAGDQAELTTLRQVFGGPDGTRRAVIGTVKSMIGHAMPAAGVAGLVKAALAVHHGVLLPTLHCEDPHPALAGTRFHPIDTAQAWEATAKGQPRRAAVNAFGFGGINAHLVLEQAPGTDSGAAINSRPRGRGPAGSIAVTEPERVLRLTAASPAGLARALEAPDTQLLAAEPSDDAHRGGARLGIVDPTAKRLAVARKVVAKAAGWRGRNDIWFSTRPLLADGRSGVAFVFPGLDAEFTARVEDIAEHFGWAKPDLSVSNLGRHGASVIRVGRLLDTALRRIGITPNAVAGHSVGEWSAMISAGMHDPAEVDPLLDRFDPDALQVPGVDFAVLGCGVDRAAEAIAASPDVVISHENSPNQTIVCGPAAAIGELVRGMRARAVLCQVLPFRSGFHTPMLKPYLRPFVTAADALRVSPPSVPVWSATTASVYPRDEAAVRELYVRHLLEPVRFQALINAMYQAGLRVFVQVGPGQVGSLVEDTLGKREHLTVPAISAHRGGLDQLRRVATALWVEGGRPDFTALSPAGAGATPAVGKPARAAPIRLDLSGALVRLGSAAPDLRVASVGGFGDRLPAALSGLDGLGGEFPVAAEFSALLKETAHAAEAVLTAAGRATPPRYPPAAPPSGARGWPAAPKRLVSTLRVATTTMPYLLDHCFAAQRDGWPDDTDRRPVVPATTTIKHMMDAAETSAPGMHAIGVHDVALNRWLVAAPPVDVTVTVTPLAADRVEVTLGDYARSVVLLAPSYPTDMPVAWPSSTVADRAPTITAEQFYRERWMFHGPRYQGITELSGVGDRHVRGMITVPTAPGGLLDNIGQLFGHWIMETQTTKRVVFPVSIHHIRFFGGEWEPGTELECVVRVRSITDTAYEFDAQLTRHGRVWADIGGWQDHRFDSHPDTDAAYRFPERNTLSSRQHGGWFLVAERWPGLASRDLYLHKYLNAIERAEYQALAPRQQRHWLLGRIAVKDAVRSWLWDHGQGPLFPAEILVRDDDAGRLTVTGCHGLELPELDVSLAHSRELGVALARPRTAPQRGVGIDVEEVLDGNDSTLSEPEKRLLAELGATTGDSMALWSTTFLAAKRAVAKAEAVGLSAATRFTITRAAPGELTILVSSAAARSRVYQVGNARMNNPTNLPERCYIVAWTTAVTEEDDS